MFRQTRAGAPLLGTALVLLAACQGDPPSTPNPPLTPDAGLNASAGFYGQGGAPTGPVGRPCSAPAYRQFDFWVGTWLVTDVDGIGNATNFVTRELNGCAVFENYAEPGYRGRSINAYDAATGQWHQHWMDNNSLPVRLDGGIVNGAMRLQGERPTPTGPRVDRITWTPLAPDLVRQFWDISSDGGQTFDVVQFDGYYHRRASVTPVPEDPTTLCLDPAFPLYRTFDFTIGTWEVRTGTGMHAGRPELESTIATDLSSCLLEEKLTGVGGYEARVFSSMRRRTGEWLRTYVDNHGLRVFLHGFPGAGPLVLNGTMPGPKGAVVQVRAAWVTQDADHFVVRYETSSDNGATWTSLLDARYARAS